MAITIPGIELANVAPGAVLLGSDEKGINETFKGFIDTASGRYGAYIKILGGRQLVNELISTTMGRAVGLPVPQGYLLRILPEDLPESVLLKNHGGEALAFGSRDIGEPSLTRRIKDNGDWVIDQLFSTWREWDTAMIFDDWIANGDRHPGNLLVGKPGEVWLIDHSHSFTGPNWNEPDLIPDRMYQNQLGQVRIPKLTLPERMTVRTKAGQLSSAFSLVDPNLALTASFADRLLNASEVKTISNFLQMRVAKLIDIVSSRLGIPNLGV